MTISELIERLEAIKDEIGDLPLIFSNDQLVIDPWGQFIETSIRFNEDSE